MLLPIPLCRILLLDTRLETQGHKEGSRETPRLSIPPEHLTFARCPFMEAFSPTLVHIPTAPGEVGYEVTTPVLPGEPFHSLLPLPKDEEGDVSEDQNPLPHTFSCCYFSCSSNVTSKETLKKYPLDSI